MAAPIFQQQGTFAAVTAGNLTVVIPAVELADDILVVTTVAWVGNTTTGANTIAAPSGWAKFTPDITTITGGLIDAEYSFFWKRAVGGDADPVFVRPTGWDTGNDTCWAGRCYVIRGCATTGDPWDSITSTAISTAQNPAFPAITVSGNERLAVVFAVKADNASLPTAATGYTAQLEATTATGTDAAANSYTIASTNTSVSAVTPSGGNAPAQGGTVYFGVSFKPPAAAVIDRTASNIGSSYQSSFSETSTGAATLTTANPHYGMGFKTETTHIIDNVSVQLRRTASPTGDVVVQLWSAGTGTYGSTQIPGTLLATSVGIDSATISTTTESKQFFFTGANRVEITADTAYYIVVYHANAAAATNFVSVAYVRGIYATASGNGVFSSSNGTVFNADSPATDVLYAVELASAKGLRVVERTATGSGAGSETATGTFFTPVVVSRTADGSGLGTETATGVRVKIRTAISDGGLGGAVDGFTPIGLAASSNSWPTSSDEFKGMSFTGDGRKLSSVSFVLTRRNAGETGLLYARLYAHTGTYGTTGTGTGSPLATSTPIDVTTIPTSNSGLRLNVRFDFPDSNKYLLVDGTNYVIGVFYGASGIVNPISIYGNITSTLNYYSGSPSILSTVWTTGSGIDYSFAVEAVSATGVVVKTSTATGSGLGAETVSSEISFLIRKKYVLIL